MYAAWSIVPPHKLKNTSFNVTGYSISAIRTAFYVDGLRMLLDVGLPYKYVPKIILITHGHTDHYYEVAHGISEEYKPIILCPAEIKDDLANFIDLTRKMNNYGPITQLLTMVPLLPGQEYIYDKHIIETFKCYHSIPTIGYGIYTNVQRLKEEYKNSTKQEIIQAKKNGNEITQECKNKLFCYLCDTTTQVFEDTSIFEYATIFIECTFIDPDTVQRAIERYHVHWSQLEPIIRDHPANIFILFHFSNMYDPTYIKKFFDQYQDIYNMKVWC